jgi:hypothetical protein
MLYLFHTLLAGATIVHEYNDKGGIVIYIILKFLLLWYLEQNIVYEFQLNGRIPDMTHAYVKTRVKWSPGWITAGAAVTHSCVTSRVKSSPSWITVDGADDARMMFACPDTSRDLHLSMCHTLIGI